MNSPILSVFWQQRAFLTNGSITRSWPISWMSSLSFIFRPTVPASSNRGELAMLALAMALIALLNPGPAVTKATPGFRVNLPHASAINTAACSCRVVKISRGDPSADSYKGFICPPQRLKTLVTPFSIRASTASCPPDIIPIPFSFIPVSLKFLISLVPAALVVKILLQSSPSP